MQGYRTFFVQFAFFVSYTTPRTSCILYLDGNTLEAKGTVLAMVAYLLTYQEYKEGPHLFKFRNLSDKYMCMCVEEATINFFSNSACSLRGGKSCDTVVKAGKLSCLIQDG